jgi:CheY-like chemotaxis protein
MIADLLAETLEAMGHQVCAVVATEDQSVAAAALHRPDLLLVDAHLQEGNGLSAVERILRDGPVAHIFMSGDAFIGDRLDPGAVTLRKPFQDNDLERAIELAFTRTSAALRPRA